MNETGVGVGIQIGDLGIFRTEEEYKKHIRQRYSPHTPTIDEEGSSKVWRFDSSANLPDVPYLWTKDANEKLISY